MPTKKATKKTTKKAAKSTPEVKKDITEFQKKILKSLGSRGLSRPEICAKANLKAVDGIHIGNLHEDKYPSSLKERGLVKIERQEIRGKNQNIYTLTSKGKSLLKKLK